MSSPVLAQARMAVDRLLDQYREYLAVQVQVQDAKRRLTQAALELARETGQPFPTLLKELPGRLGELDTEVRSLEQRLQTISDDMTFANPVVWMQYKFEAYAGTSQAITDMQDFRKHCSKPGYICTKRFEFLNTWLEKTGADLRDTTAFPDAQKLSEVYSSRRIVELCENAEFMRQWDGYEYYRTADGAVAKWETYS